VYYLLTPARYALFERVWIEINKNI